MLVGGGGGVEEECLMWERLSLIWNFNYFVREVSRVMRGQERKQKQLRNKRKIACDYWKEVIGSTNCSDVHIK